MIHPDIMRLVPRLKGTQTFIGGCGGGHHKSGDPVNTHFFPWSHDSVMNHETIRGPHVNYTCDVHGCVFTGVLHHRCEYTHVCVTGVTQGRYIIGVSTHPWCIMGVRLIRYITRKKHDWACHAWSSRVHYIMGMGVILWLLNHISVQHDVIEYMNLYLLVLRWIWACCMAYKYYVVYYSTGLMRAHRLG